MTKKARRILLVACIVLFLIVAPALVFYSQGYRFDFENRKIVQTGAFYFKVWPREAEIHLNGKLKKKTPLLFEATLIGNLLPKSYSVEIKKEGYHSWKKELEIKEKQVTEAKNLILFPQNPKFELLVKETKDFFFSPDQKEIIVAKLTKTGWLFDLFDLETQTITPLIPTSFNSEVELLDLAWSQNPERLLIKTAYQEQLQYSLFDFSKNQLIPFDFLGSNIEKVSFVPKEESKIFFLKNNNFYLSDFSAKDANLLIENLVTYEVFGENIFWFSQEGLCHKSDLSGKILELLNLKPLSIKTETMYRLFKEREHIFLQEGSNLFFLDPKSKEFEKIFDSFKTLQLAPDLKKVLIANSFEISVFFLEEEQGQPQRKAKDKIFLTRFAEKIDNISWLSSHYVVFNVGNTIKIVELDSRDGINVIDFSQTPVSKMFFLKGKLFFSSNGNLYVSENLLE